MKKLILVLTIVFIIIIIIFISITNLFKQKQSNPELSSTITTPTPYGSSGLQLNQKKLGKEYEEKLKEEKISQSIKIMSIEEVQKLNDLKKLLPFTSADFDIVYSDFLNTFIVSLKTPGAKEKFLELLQKNNASSLLDYPNLIVFTDKPAESYRLEIETKYEAAREKNINTAQLTPTSQPIITNIVTPVVSPTISELQKAQNQANLLTDFLSFFLNIQLSSSTPSSTIYSQPSTANPQLSSINPPLSLLTLSSIISEASQKVGVPVKIIEGVMKVESSTFSYSDEEINAYSQPGSQIPNCFINTCSEKGPMQFTTGHDRYNGTTCPGCGAGYCPNTWSQYSSSVNSYGGYTHTPEVCNIRDSVYAATALLKDGAKAVNSTTWTQEEVYRAITRYNGRKACENKFDRLGGKTYCEYVWEYYKNN
jgi:hypothetical protein